MRSLHLPLLALTLVLAGLGLFLYKAQVLNYPLAPDAERALWTVEARVDFRAERGRPIQAELAIPKSPPGYVILDEDFIAPNYGITTEESDGARLVHFTIRRAQGQQTLYYRAVIDRYANGGQAMGPNPPPPIEPTLTPPMRGLVRGLTDRVREQSADVASFTRELILLLNDATPKEDVRILQKQAKTPRAWVQQLIDILATRGIPARPALALPLTENASNLTPRLLLQVHNGSRWLTYDPVTAEPGLPPQTLLWHTGNEPLIALEGGQQPRVEFALARTYEPMLEVAMEQTLASHSPIAAFSILQLPVQTQNLYRILFLVPIGALLVVVLRNLVGVKTFGTFMPILIALAFRETQLLWGIVMFSTLVAAGLLLRFYLEELKLLLVPRLASVLIIVVLLMFGLSLLTHQLGLERGLSVALFPMVILAMTIERMSIIWEEHGPAEALQQGVGSLLVASLGYLVMAWPLLGYLMAVFPELLLVVLAITLLLGRYTGYRLSELRRFRAAGEDW